MIRFLQTKTRTKQIVLGALLVLICVTMVITLIPGFSSGDFGPSTGALVRVGGEDVTTNEVQVMARQIAKQQMRGQPVPDQLMPYFLQSAAENMIVQKVLMAEAARLGLRVTDAELRDELQKGQLGQAFFPNGNFVGQEQYEDFVAQNFNLSVAQFEQEVKKDLLLRKLRDAVTAGVAVSDEDVRKEFERQNVKVKFDYALLSLDELKKQIKPTDAELKAFFEQSKARYQNSVPEKRKARYVSVDSARVLAEVKAALKPEDLQKYYDAHTADFKVPESAKASHILIRTPPPGPDGKPDAKGVEAARAKADDILKKLRAGADFAAMAKKESQDPGSAQKGGDLGSFARGAMVAEFDKAAFSQPVGKIGDLVQSQFGFHIIKVESRQEAHTKPFADVKDDIAGRLAQEAASSRVDALAGKLLADARAQGLDKAAAANHLQVVDSEWFARTDSLPGVGAAQEFMNAAFTQKPNAPPELVKMAQGLGVGGVGVTHYVVLQVTDSKPAETPAFEQIRAKVEDDFRSYRVQQLLAQKTQELADRAHAEHDLKKAAKELGATLKSADFVAPGGQVPDLGSMEGQAAAAFALNKGEISGALSFGDKGAVLQVTDKQGASPEEFARQKDQVRETVLQSKRQMRLQFFISGARERMEKDGKIRINKNEWTRVFGTPPSAT